MTKSKSIPSIPISREIRYRLELPDSRYDNQGRFQFSSQRDARELAALYKKIHPGAKLSAADLYGSAYIVTAWRLLLEYWAKGGKPYEKEALRAADTEHGKDSIEKVLTEIMKDYPDNDIWTGGRTPLESVRHRDTKISGRMGAMGNWVLVNLALENPAFEPFLQLFVNTESENVQLSKAVWNTIQGEDSRLAPRVPEDNTPLAALRKPIAVAPTSVKDQLAYILTRWGAILGDWAAGLLGALDMITEEARPRFAGPGPARRAGLGDLDDEARFSNDVDWMPQVVLIAKNALVWLDQLSRTYNRPIRTLDGIPDEELDILASRGFNALWLIGLWERSSASQKIKRQMGNPEAAASAYSLYQYDIAGELGGWEALENLRHRGMSRGIRLASDMIPNHVGLDSDWVRKHPDWLLTVEDCPFPSYSYNSDNLSEDSRVDIRLEDHYWDHSDAAVVFQRIDKETGEIRYVYHGNDGTLIPWNDTAQIDFLNSQAREAVIQDILHVARNFSLIRFDTAMVLAKKHIRRLWYPSPGSGGDIPSRSAFAMDDEAFNEALPLEFWKEVVDRVNAEVPGTLLLAEAFWMMEGYFVRSLGMHRVYNSAFMNMLRDQDNDEYKSMIKEILAFDPGILQRFVNFMNNPDEETAVKLFGDSDSYFAVCTLLATMPGLPMFGHGQVEGLSEKYGMEYVKAYYDEHPNVDLIARHEREIFPLLAQRSIFAGAQFFRLYDLHTDSGEVNENVYAYTNTDGWNPSLILVNNAYKHVAGTIKSSAPVSSDNGSTVYSLSESLGLTDTACGDWILLWDFVGNLWYLRSLGSFQNDGFRIHLDGFGRQVFLKFRSFPEAPDAVWAKLAEEIGDAGIEDPDRAIKDIRLRPFRSALNALFPEGYVESAAASIQKGRVPKVSGNLTSFNHRIEKILNCHRQLTGKNEGCDPSEIVLQIRRCLAGSARHYRVFGGGIRRLLNRRFNPPGSREAEFQVVWSLLAPLVASGGTVQTTARWKAWGLEAWLEEEGLAGKIPRLAQNLTVALADPMWIQAGKTPKERLVALMARNEIREAAGVNSKDGILWFVHEKWIETQRILALTAGASSENRRSQTYKIVKSTLRQWKRAAQASGYHIDRLLQGLR